MNIELNKEYEFYGKIESVISSTYDTYPINIILSDGSHTVVRLKNDIELPVGEIYHFSTIAKEFKNKIHLYVKDYYMVEDTDQNRDILNQFNHMTLFDTKEAINYIENTLSNIENKVLKDITNNIYNKYKEEFIIHPAATRFHHTYKSGLLLHTYNMLKMSKAIISIYSHINEDLVYSGIILHDVMKIKEFDDKDKKYKLEGNLIGHISLGSMEVAKEAACLGYENEEEVTLLSHILLSHHGEKEYGSPKNPQIIEALVVHYCDALDSKIIPAIEGLDKVNILDYSEPINTCDRTKFYKHKLSK